MIFNVKLTDLPVVLFKIFYFMAKVNGLLPITITFTPSLVASYSFTDQLYSILYTGALIVGLPYFQSHVIEFIGILHNPKLTIIFVFLTQVSCSGLRVVAIYLSQIFNYKNLSRFINHSVEINGRFKQPTDENNSFLDSKLSHWCLSKCVSMIFQVVFMLVPSAGFVSMIKTSENVLFLMIAFTFILYTHMVLILSTGIYFIGMIVIGQFYRNLNAQLIGLQKKFFVDGNCKAVGVKMQKFCNFSDEFDRLTALYRSLTNLANKFNKYQRCFIVFSLMQYFVILLAEMFDVYTQIMRNINNSDTNPKNSLFTQLLKEFGFISFYVIELYYTIRVTSFVQNEAGKTSALIKLCSRPDYDIRLRRSMVATFASYLIILVQFVEDE